MGNDSVSRATGLQRERQVHDRICVEVPERKPEGTEAPWLEAARCPLSVPQSLPRGRQLWEGPAVQKAEAVAGDRGGPGRSGAGPHFGKS